MKRTITIFVLTVIFCSKGYGQKLSLTDITNLCNKKNWEDVNQSLLTKGWIYYDSEKGSTYKYNTITWSFNKGFYDDHAQGWFDLYTYEGLPNKISYSFFNKESYSLIQNSISSAGFKLVNSEIEDNGVISTYGNASYTLKISTEKRTDNNMINRSTTAYRITLIKKAGIYDKDNGKKTDYYYGDVIKAEYTLINGEKNGQLKVYHYNGKLKKVGNYSNGIENGIFKEYDENGNLEGEYSKANGFISGSIKTYYSNGNLKLSGYYTNGKQNGNFKFYENGKITNSTTFKDDVKNGLYIEYSYNDENGELKLKQLGEYLNDEKSGTWKLVYMEDNKERILIFDNYTKGIKNGAFQHVQGDSLIIGNYRNDKINGGYKIYLDASRMFLGGVIRTDISNLTLLTEGSYYEGLKSGYWKNYDLTSTLRNEGNFSNGQKTGEWKHYYTNWTNEEGESMSYSKQLYLIQNYSNGRLDGKSTRYSYLNEDKYPCSELYENQNLLDTCKKYVYKKVLETNFYKDDTLFGPFELRDSLNSIIAKGSFKNNLKDGEWLYRYNDKDINNETYYIYQKGNYLNGKCEGKWIQYYKEDKISETFNYKNGKLHGEYVSWNNLNKPREIKQFSNGKLKELITFDSLGVNKVNRYEIYEEKFSSYKTRKTEYLDNGFVTQEYWLNKEKEIDHNWFELTFLISIDTVFFHGTKGYKDGLFSLYDSQNNPLITGKYYKEDSIDLWTFYYYDQNVKIESNFENDTLTDKKYLKLNGELFSGEFTFIDKENGIKEIRKIKGGLKKGKISYIDIKTGKTIKKASYKNRELK